MAIYFFKNTKKYYFGIIYFKIDKIYNMNKKFVKI